MLIPVEHKTNIANCIDFLLSAYLKDTGLSEDEIEAVSFDVRRGEFHVSATPIAPMQSVTLEVRFDD